MKNKIYKVLGIVLTMAIIMSTCVCAMWNVSAETTLEFAMGNVHTQTGEFQINPQTHRATVTTALALEDYESITIKEGWKAWFYAVKSDGVTLSDTTGNGAWATGSYALSGLTGKSDATYFTITVAQADPNDNADFTLEDIPADVVTLKEAGFYAQGNVLTTGEKFALNSSTGTRVTTRKLLVLDDYESITLASGYKAWLYAYKADGTFINTTGSGTWVEGTYALGSLTSSAEAVYFSVTVATTDNAAITPDTVPEDALTFKKAGFYAQGNVLTTGEKFALNSSTGTRVTTRKLLVLDDYESVTLASGYKAWLYAYKADGTFINTTGTGTWVEGTYALSKLTNSLDAVYFSVTVATTDNAAITPDTVPEDALTLTKAKMFAQGNVLTTGEKFALNSSTGTRVTTRKLIAIGDYSKVTVPAGYKAWYYAYKLDGTFIDTAGSKAWMEGSYTLSNLTTSLDAAYFSVTIATTDNADITPATAPEADVVFTKAAACEGHVYDNDCDALCNLCRRIREVGDHVYDNACDANCNNCGATREVGDHVYDHFTDAECNECGFVREIIDYGIYFDNTTSNSFWLTGLGMESPNLPAGNSYTVEMDVYALTQGANIVFNGVQGHFNTDYAIPDGQVWKDAPTDLNKWVTLKYDITTTATLGGVYLHILGDAGFKGYVDNFKIKDSTGAVIFEFEPNDTTKTSNGASVVELPAEIEYAKNPDYAILADNSQGSGYNEIFSYMVGISQSHAPAGKYIVEFDFYALETGNSRFIYSANVEGWTAGESVAQTWNDENLPLVKDAWQKVRIPVTAIQDGVDYQKIRVGAGVKGYIDNWKLIAEDGTVYTNFAFSATELGKTTNDGTAAVAIVPMNVTNAKATCIHDYTYTTVYPDCDDDGVRTYTCSVCEDKFTVKFADKNGHTYDNACDTNCNVCDEVREVPDHVDADDNNVCDICAFGDYAIYFDNTSSNNFWVTKLGMEEPNLPAGNTYTVEFDVYALTAGKNVTLGATTASWITTPAIEGGHQVWKDAPTNLNAWTHYSFNVTTIEAWNGVMFYVISNEGGGAFKGYVDNLIIKDSTGNVVASFDPTAADLSESSNGAYIVALSKELEYAKNPDYSILVDNSTESGYTEIFSYMVGISEAHAPAGKYIVEFDFYALETGNSRFIYSANVEGWTAGESVNMTWNDENLPLVKDAWQKVRIPVTAIQDGVDYQKIWVGAGVNGYIDNWKLIAEDGTVYTNFAFSATELGKSNGSTATVVTTPANVFLAREDCIHDYTYTTVYPDCDDDGVRTYTCSVCGDEFTVKFADKNGHTYDNACDTNCNVCDEVREVPDHVYDNACDANCNVCDAVREVEDHVYDNACDTNCNICDEVREVPDHVYDNACDTNCNICDEVREVPDHVYDNACDTNCNECDEVREVPDHVYDNACDTNCNECGEVREVPDHVYDNACDTNCNVCGEVREVPDHVYDNACDANCNVCDAVREVPDHVYDNVCDTNCNVCDEVREVPDHVFENYVSNNDATCTADGTKTAKCEHCSVTDTITDEGSMLDHEYKNYVSNNDATCTADGTKTGTCVCGATETITDEGSMLDHEYKNYVSNGDATCMYDGTKTGTCVCGATETIVDEGSKLDHKYSNDLDPTCNACGELREFIVPADKIELVEVDGEKYIYVDGKTSVEGLFEVDGKYYYATWGGKVNKGGKFYVSASYCDMPSGKAYTFGEDGSLFNGFATEDGVKKLYVDGKTTVEGLFEVDGDYYYTTWGGVVLTGDHYVHTSYCDMTAGRHFYFDEDGKMLMKGFVTGEDGVKKLYIDGRTSVEGLFEVDGKYYLATWGGVVLTSGRYYVTESFCDREAGANFEVDSNGEVLDGIVEKGGKEYYYDFGTVAAKGTYEFNGQTIVVDDGGVIVG